MCPHIFHFRKVLSPNREPAVLEYIPKQMSIHSLQSFFEDTTTKEARESEGAAGLRASERVGGFCSGKMMNPEKPELGESF